MTLDDLERKWRKLSDIRDSSLELETTRLLKPDEVEELSEARTRFHIDTWNAWPSLADAVLRLVEEARAARAWLAAEDSAKTCGDLAGGAAYAVADVARDRFRAFLAKSGGGG